MRISIGYYLKKYFEKVFEIRLYLVKSIPRNYYLIKINIICMNVKIPYKIINNSINSVKNILIKN